mmetsp:Transcript_12782/g.35353  ORF Transcript_12782/g.35353 Transcript_12782/m.35353 type:complete len:334 (+) Transcript_12782:647-1648(+)
MPKRRSVEERWSWLWSEQHGSAQLLSAWPCPWPCQWTWAGPPPWSRCSPSLLDRRRSWLVLSGTGTKSEFGRMTSGGTRPCLAESTTAVRFSACTMAVARWISASVAMSALFSSTRSAHSSCSARSVLRRSAPSAGPGHPAPPPGAGAPAPKSAAKVGLSTRATVRATRVPLSSSCSSTPLTARGSATPLSSTTIASGARPAAPGAAGSGRSSSRTLLSRSSEAEQQTQPFASSTLRAPALWRAPLSTRASTFTEAKSFTSTPSRKPWLLVRRCSSSVVFPAPRNPDTRITGTLVRAPPVTETADKLRPIGTRRRPSWVQGTTCEAKCWIGLL